MSETLTPASPQIRKPLRPSDITGPLARRAVKELMKTLLMDRTLLLLIVCDGKTQWMNSARRAFRGYTKYVDDDTIEAIWQRIEEEAGPEPKRTLDAALKAGLVRLKLDKIRNLALILSKYVGPGGPFGRLEEILQAAPGDDDERAAMRLFVGRELVLLGCTPAD
jgi:hypothetical protein